MTLLRLAASFTAALILSGCADPAARQPETPERVRAVPLVDYHQHVRGPLATKLYYKEIYPKGAETPDPVARDAQDIIGQLNEAGIKRAVLLSTAYWFGDPDLGRVRNAHQLVRAENEWTAAEAARFPDRLVAFCSFNPLSDYALRELEWCASSGKFRGLKLHFGNSEVDIRKPDHAQKVIRVFQAANAAKLPIVAHLWTEPAYEEQGAEHATVFLDRILPAAPDIVVQIAHLAGGGFTTEAAFEVFANAIAARDPRTKNLYFDVATSVTPQLYQGNVEDLAARFRQVGMDRILYGSDMGSVRDGWGNFRSLLPLSDQEIMDIADNVAPYMK